METVAENQSKGKLDQGWALRATTSDYSAGCVIISERTGRTVAVTYNEADTAEIVHRCNAYSELLEAIERMGYAALGLNEALSLAEIRRIARAAIAKAVQA